MKKHTDEDNIEERKRLEAMFHEKELGISQNLRKPSGSNFTPKKKKRKK